MRLEVLRLYGRLLRFLRPHGGYLAGAVLFMGAFAAFSGFTLAMIVPFTEIVLSGEGPGELSRRHGTVPTGVPGLELSLPEEGAPSGGSGSSGSGAGGTQAGTSETGSTETGTPETRASGTGAGGEGAEVEGNRLFQDRESPAGIVRSGLALRQRLEAGFYHLIEGRDRRSTLSRFCVALFLIFLLKNLFWYAQSFLIVRVEQNVIRDIRNRVFEHYHKLSLDYFARSHSGTLISRITNDVDLVRGAIANGIADLLRQSLLLLVYLITVLLASWQLFLFAIIVLPPNLWLIDRIGQTLRRSSRVSQSRMARLTSVLSETLGGMRIVKAFGLERERTGRFSEETHGYARTMIRMTRIGSLASPLTEILGVLVAVLILWYAGSRIAGGEAASGRFLLFIIGMLSMMQPIKVLSQVNIKIQQGLAAARRIFEVLDARPSVADPPGAAPLRGFESELRMEGVEFAYRQGVPVLESIDLTISKGKVLALVGPSGAGKSTLVDLIPRFYDPTAGRILLDGRDLRALPLADLRRQIGLVTQETILFEGTVRQNILMGRPDASAAEIEAAARAANAHEFIAEMPDGYDTWIGERGLLLSGGQRQRLSIARALLKNPTILIFDEATSALDSESEALVQEAIDRLLRNRTAIVIAHRLSTVRHADGIVVLAGGRIVQSGRHETLLAQDGLYQRLYQMQFRDRAEEDLARTEPA
jgi:subfamily B ATP-binding cassette protein MsbA